VKRKTIKISVEDEAGCSEFRASVGASEILNHRESADYGIDLIVEELQRAFMDKVAVTS
jgi:hypothetical protein